MGVDVQQLLLEGQALQGEVGTVGHKALLGRGRRRSYCSLLLLSPGQALLASWSLAEVFRLGSSEAGGCPQVQALAPIIVENNFHWDDLLDKNN